MSPSRRLDAGELAEAAVLSDVSLILALAGWFLPFGGILYLAASVPFAALAARRRLRAVVIGAAASAQVAFLLGGVNLEINLLSVAAVGLVVGRAYRAGWRRPGTVALAIPVLWVPGAAMTLVFLAVFSDARRLALEQLDIGTRWLRSGLRQAGDVQGADRLDEMVRWFLTHWWLVIPAAELAGAIVVVLLARRVAVPALRRIDSAFARPDPAARRGPGVAAVPLLRPEPVPAELEQVVVRHVEGAPAALDDVTLRIEPGEFVAVVGDNGSGKSTLARVLAGRAPTGGRTHRPGPVGLGRRHGTAIVFQRPESQVLGVRVKDDVVWGLTAEDARHVDVDGLLARVGLASFASRETATLSGGELQRLAIAAALARGPLLLVSDESTAMVDPPGRQVIVTLLRSLAAEGIAVVHVTHHADEAAAADRIVTLAHGRVIADERRDDVATEGVS